MKSYINILSKPDVSSPSSENRQESYGYGRLSEGLGLREGVGGVVAGVLRFLKKLSKAGNSSFES
jgi:hypothetical protein